jgi:PadR family transcriptional regulator, regulatory protein AphA
MLKFALLGSLSYQPMSGYDLKLFIDSSTSNFWHAELSQIYVTLKSMENEGLVTCTEVTQETRPDRKVYTLTTAGQITLDRWLAEPLTGLSQTKEPLLLKLFFSAHMPRETILAQLRMHQTLHSRLLEHFDHESAALIAQTDAQAPELHKDTLLWEATRRFGVMIEETYLRWLDETIALVADQF